MNLTDTEYIEQLERLLDSWNANVNNVTVFFRHQRKVPTDRLVKLCNAQIDLEERFQELKDMK